MLPSDDRMRAVRGMARAFVALRPVGRSLDAEDLEQEGLLAALAAMRRKGSESVPDEEFLGYARRGMKAALSAALKQSAGAAAAIDAHYARDKPPALRPEEELDVREAVASLPAEQALAVRLKDLEGMTNEEAAAAMGASTPRVKRLRAAAAPALAARLAPSYAEEFGRAVRLRRPELWKAEARRIGRAQPSKPGRRRDSTGGHRRRRAAQIEAYGRAVQAGLFRQGTPPAREMGEMIPEL